MTQTLGSLESCALHPTNLPYPLISGYLSHFPVFSGQLALLALRHACPTLASWLRSAAKQMYLGSIWTPHRTPILSPSLNLKPLTAVLFLCSGDEYALLQGCPVQTPDTTKCTGPWSLQSIPSCTVIIDKDLGHTLPISWTQGLNITISGDTPGRHHNETPHLATVCGISQKLR